MNSTFNQPWYAAPHSHETLLSAVVMVVFVMGTVGALRALSQGRLLEALPRFVTAPCVVGFLAVYGIPVQLWKFLRQWIAYESTKLPDWLEWFRAANGMRYAPAAERAYAANAHLYIDVATGRQLTRSERIAADEAGAASLLASMMGEDEQEFAEIGEASDYAAPAPSVEDETDLPANIELPPLYNALAGNTPYAVSSLEEYGELLKTAHVTTVPGQRTDMHQVKALFAKVWASRHLYSLS